MDTLTEFARPCCGIFSPRALCQHLAKEEFKQDPTATLKKVFLYVDELMFTDDGACTFVKPFNLEIELDPVTNKPRFVIEFGEGNKKAYRMEQAWTRIHIKQLENYTAEHGKKVEW